MQKTIQIANKINQAVATKQREFLPRQYITAVRFLQAAQNSSRHAMRAKLEQLKTPQANVQTHVIDDTPRQDDFASGKCDAGARLDADSLQKWVPTMTLTSICAGPNLSCNLCLSSRINRVSRNHRSAMKFFGPLQDLASTS
jgi:hypothetical protein